MNRLFLLLDWELRRLLRARTTWYALGGLVLAGVLALASARVTVRAQESAQRGLSAHYAAQMERVAAHFHDGGEAGYVAYSTFFPTFHPPPPLASLALGVREVSPSVVWVRLLGLEGQIHDAEIGNPALQALGGYDFAFVVLVLVPLALLVITHDVLSRDRAAGRLPLLAAQAGSLVTLLAVRVVLRAGLLGGVVTLLALAGADASGALVHWLAAAWALLAVWTGLAAWIAAACRTPAVSLAVALGSWVALVVLGPALVNLATSTLHPVTEGLELTVRQRQEIHGGWDKSKDETFARFQLQNPDWTGAPVTGRFAWRWYYAMHQVGDESVAAESQAYRRHLRARSDWIARWLWWLPPAYGQQLLAGRAGTDLEAQLDYLERVRAFHAGLRRYFYPMIFATPERVLRPSDFADFPRFTPSPPSPGPGRSAAPLWLLAAVLAGLALQLVHRRPVLA